MAGKEMIRRTGGRKGGEVVKLRKQRPKIRFMMG